MPNLRGYCILLTKEGRNSMQIPQPAIMAPFEDIISDDMTKMTQHIGVVRISIDVMRYEP